MKFRTTMLLALAGLTACASAPHVTPMPEAANELHVSARDGQTLAELEIVLLVSGDDDGETVFRFPENWGPEENLGKLRHGLSAIDAETGAPLAMSESGPQVAITHSPGQRIKLSWTLRQDYTGLPQWGVQRVPGMRPVLQPDYASVIGQTVLPSIDGRDPDVIVRLDGVPGGGAFSLPLIDAASAPVALSVARDSLYALGAYTFNENPVVGIRTAILGEWALPDDQIAETTAAVIGTASAAFQDTPPDQYFVALTPLPDLPSGSSVIGTALTQSFFILATRNAEADNLEHTIVHEILHEWITGRMGTTEESTDPTRMWFVEGFTEYYTQLILLDSGRITFDGFLGNLNDLWAAYQTSPVQTMPSSELLEHIWDSRETERLPYQRGALMALSWETVAAGRGTSLADALADLIDRGASQRASGTAAELTDAAIRDALEEAVGPVFVQDLSDHIEQGNLIAPADLSLPGCLTIDKIGEAPARFALAEGADPAECRATLVSSLHRGG
jgi:predicted metalloprotease with PDZ domain